MAATFVVLRWSAVPLAAGYQICRGAESDLLFDPGNFIATVEATTFICENCLDDPNASTFFGVIAVGQ
jgi:hypothetical protein